RLVTKGRLQRRRPAVVLLEVAGEPLPAGRRPRALLGSAVLVGDLLELVAQQKLLEFRLLLDVDLVLAVLDAVKGRLGDVDVTPLAQIRALAVEAGEDHGA